MMTAVLGLGIALAIYELATDRDERHAFQDYVLYLKSIARASRKKRRQGEGEDEDPETGIEIETKKEKGYEYFNKQLTQQNVQMKYMRQRLVPETFDVWNPMEEEKQRRKELEASKEAEVSEETLSKPNNK
mmetsp:Transcript_14047/g.15497  ORF Transcript_14047/g.15497 Transcript_14047/m.15497 type:complete len:131 (+) Transcript_14047:1-393(+)